MFRLLIILLISSTAVKSSSMCPDKNYIECRSTGSCTRISYICDGGRDCGDGSDEDRELCRAWGEDACSRGYVRCNRNGNRGCIRMQEYCNSQPECNGELDMRICKMLQDERIQRLEDIILDSAQSRAGAGVNGTSNLEMAEVIGQDFKEMTQHTLKHDECPLLYTRVGDECISFFFFGNVTWGESRMFCQTIGGDLYVPETNEKFISLVRHMNDHHLTSNFWVGGNRPDTTIGWKWVTDAPIQQGTPHWALRHNVICNPREIHIEYRNATVEANDGFCYHYTQAPEEVPYGDCVAMTYDKFFYLSDEDCLRRMSPLCKLA